MNLGHVVVTRGINNEIERNENFARFVRKSLRRYINKDWGSTCKEDRKMNDYAVENDERILASYEHEELPKIWIITEWDRSVTTILFPEEY